MNIEHLVRMANDIGAFFASEPDQDDAAQNVCTHLQRFWDPRMRAQIAAHYKAGGEGFTPVVRAAVGLLHASERQAQENRKDS